MRVPLQVLANGDITLVEDSSRSLRISTEDKKPAYHGPVKKRLKRGNYEESKNNS